MKDFVNLHAHTNLGSMLDALVSVDDLFDKIKELGQKALAITDHGTLAAHYDAFQAYKRTGIKFIPGCEAYFVHSYDIINKEAKGRKRTEKRKHVVLLAQNHTGYKNLLKANYIGFQNQDRFMGRIFPRISWDVLEKYSEGLICTSACANGIISAALRFEDYDRAVEIAQRFLQIFQDRFYIELHPHLLKSDDLDQNAINEQLISIAQKNGIPLICAIDTHYLTRESEKYHDVLMAINSKAPVDDPNRHRYGIDEFFAKSGDEVYTFLEKHYGTEVADEAVGNTVKIAEMCEPPDYMEPTGNHLPIFDPSTEEDYKEFLEWKQKAGIKNLNKDAAFMRFRVFKGFKDKFKNLSGEEIKERLERVKREIKMFEKNSFSSYMLVVADFIKWAKENDILSGIGRGCLSGDSLVLTSDSFKKLKNIKNGELVLTHKGRFRSVLNTFKYAINESLIELHTDYSFMPISLTKDHMVYATKAIKTSEYAQSLQNNWKLPFKGKKYEVKHTPMFISACQLSKEDFIFMPFPTRGDCEIHDLDLVEYLGPHDKLENEEVISSTIPLVNKFSIREISRQTKISRGAIQRLKNGNLGSKIQNKISLYLHNHNSSIKEWQNDKNCEIRRINRFLKCDEEFCYIVGRWIGDGWISDKYQTYNIGITFHRSDIDGKNRVLNYFQNLGFKCGISRHKEKQVDTLYIYGHIISKLFRDLFPDYKDSSSTKYLGIFKGLPKEKMKSVLLGIRHSDGHYDKNFDARESIDTTSLLLANDIREELLNLHIPSSILIRKAYQMDKYLCKESYKIRFRGLESPISSGIKDRIFDNGYYVKILDKREIKGNYVYDIHVNEDNSYVTQNFAVHNSVGGSMVAYLLGIHGVDPIQYGLLFERFQNAGKTDLPDIDVDFTSAGRDRVKKYCIEKYGREHCAQVSNINTYTPKNVIPDLVKSMRNVMPNLVPEGANYVRISEAIKAAIPEDAGGQRVKTLEKAIQLSPKLKEFADSCPELMEYADVIIGMPKEFSTHAAGMVVSDIPIVEFAPLRIDKDDTIAVQYEKNRCESVGLVKIDFLAISTLDVIDETLKNVRRLGIEDAPHQMEDIPLDDMETYKMIQDGHTRCVFQLGKSGMMATLCKQIKPREISDIAIINALGRPSCAHERQPYVDRRFGNKKIEYLHPSLANTLQQTYGLCIMEEQLMGVAKDVAGWDLNKADGLRKLTKLKGKNPKLTLQLEVDFIHGMMELHKVEYESAKKVWDEVVEKFSGYGFNNSHAIFYSINGYITAYLKRHYPAAFLAAYLKIKTYKGGISREDEIAGAKSECRRMGIKILPPDINRSGTGYEVLDNKTIVMGLTAIKGLGDKGVIEIVKNQPYESFTSFLDKTEGRVINKSKMEALAKAGCFDSLVIPRKDIHDLGKKNRDRFNVWIKKNASQDDGYDVIGDFPLKFEGMEWSKQERLRHEQEVLGELVSGSLHDLYPGFFTGVGATPISRLKILPDRHEIIVEFLVELKLREFKIKTGRYAGKPMIKYRVSDISGIETELTVWPSEYKLAKKLMDPGRPIRAICQVSEFNGVKTLMLRHIEKVYGM